MRKIMVLTGAILGALCVLGIVSWATTGRSEHGAFVPTQWRLRVRDKAGSPISGASLEVFVSGTDQVVPGLFDTPERQVDLVTDEAGAIHLRTRDTGYPLTLSNHWSLFWVIPITSWVHPGFELQVSAPGYQTSRLALRRDRFPPGKESIVVLQKCSDQGAL